MMLPEMFQNRMRDILSDADFEGFLQSMADQQLQSIRLNPSKPNPDIFETENVIPWERDACYLTNKHSFIRDPAWHSGSYYVQEASSMLAGAVLKELIAPGRPIAALDLCGAPGGKSTHLLSILPENSCLLSNETDRKRYSILQENLVKWGSANILVSNSNTNIFSRTDAAFDLIVVDAPCSGEGMMRKDDQAITHWNEKNVFSCHTRQKEILKNVARSVKPGGILFYSTCTFNKEENEQIGDWLIDEYGFTPIEIEINSSWGLVKRNGIKSQVYVCYPHLVNGEGFAFQLFRIPEHTNRSTVTLRQTRKYTSITTPGFISEVIDQRKAFTLNQHDSGDIYMSVDLNDTASLLRELFGIPQIPGIRVGQFKGKDFIPDHGLALSTLLKEDLPHVDLTLDQSLSYLKGAALEVAPEYTLEKGWFLVKYKQHILGWAKRVSGRVNNYYPKNIRIRQNL